MTRASPTVAANEKPGFRPPKWLWLLGAVIAGSILVGVGIFIGPRLFESQRTEFVRIDSAALEPNLGEQILQATGEAMQVTCPSPIEGPVGYQFECTAVSASGVEQRVLLEIDNTEGDLTWALGE